MIIESVPNNLWGILPNTGSKPRIAKSAIEAIRRYNSDCPILAPPKILKKPRANVRLAIEALNKLPAEISVRLLAMEFAAVTISGIETARAISNKPIRISGIAKITDIVVAEVIKK